MYIMFYTFLYYMYIHRLSNICHLSQLSDIPLMLEAKTIGIVASLALSTFLASGILVESKRHDVPCQKILAQVQQVSKAFIPLQRSKGYQDIPKFWSSVTSVGKWSNHFNQSKLLEVTKSAQSVHPASSVLAVRAGRSPFYTCHAFAKPRQHS